MNLSTEQRHTIDGLYRSLDADSTGTAVSVIVKTCGETGDIDCPYRCEKRKESPGGARVSADQFRRLAAIFEGRRLTMDVLQRAENEFDPIPFDVEAARIYGRVCAAVIGAGRKPRRRVAALMIAAIAIAEDLPLFTTNPDDFTGLEDLLTVVPVHRPAVLHDR
ncbi:hypothetical protein ACFQ61_01320 [Streptomyces sp. NPDC056500]|uniref:hypothetical protein n=1 Tax=Streptomyces sp. NPDC056500 TaxID=3345840 RepID=UPI003689A14E